MVTAISSAPPLTGNECLAGITSSEFNLRKLDQYERWFDDKSSMTLAQTGVYKGLDAVLEYSKFIFPGSPYISTNGNLGSEFTFVSVDAEKRSCVFIVIEQQRYQMSEMASNELFESPVMFKAEWRFDDQKIGYIRIFCAPLATKPRLAPRCVCCSNPGRVLSLACGRTDDPSFLAHFFSALSTPAADNFVCQTMRDSCPDVWAANKLTNIGECEAKLAALPLADGEELYVDGNTCASPHVQPLTASLAL